MIDTSNKAQELIVWLADSAISGVPPLTSAFDLAAAYEKDPGYGDADARVDSMIAWESTKNFGTGFLTGVGGILTLPLTIPTALAASWVIQARLVGAIALLYGHDIRSPQTRTLLAMALIGGGAKEVLKQVGVGLTVRALRVASADTLRLANRAIGSALLARTARGGAINVAKAVPLIGGTISGGVDAYMCRAVGLAAKEIFRPVPLEPREAEKPEAPVADAAPEPVAAAPAPTSSE